MLVFFLIAALLLNTEAFIGLPTLHTRSFLKPSPFTRQKAVSIITDELLEASISVTEAIEAEDIDSARSVLASLDFEGLTGAYTLAISDYFLSSATVTVEQMGTLKAFSTLVLEANEKQANPLDARMFLGYAHAASVAIFAENRDGGSGSSQRENKNAFDEGLRVGGALMHCFECCYPESMWNDPDMPDIGMSPRKLFFESSPEAMAVARHLNCVDPDLRLSNADAAACAKLQDFFDAKLRQALDATSVEAFIQSLDDITEAWIGALGLLRVTDKDAFSALRMGGRRALGEMLDKACNLVSQDLKDLKDGVSKTGFGKAMEVTDRMIALGKLWVELAGPIDYVNWIGDQRERMLDAKNSNRDDVDSGGGGGQEDDIYGDGGDEDIYGDADDDEDDRGSESKAGGGGGGGGGLGSRLGLAGSRRSAASGSSSSSVAIQEYTPKSEAELATSHLRVLALGNQARSALYQQYIRYFCKVCLSLDIKDLEDLSGDAHMIMTLTSINEYDAKDVNLRAFSEALTNTCLSILKGDSGDEADAGSLLAGFQANTTPLARNLGLTAAQEQQGKESALQEVASQAGSSLGSAEVAALVTEAGVILGLDAAAAAAAAGDGAVEASAVSSSSSSTSKAVAAAIEGEQSRRFSAQVERLVTSFLGGGSSDGPAAAAELAGAVEALGGGAAAGVGVAVGVVAQKTVEAAKKALVFEAAGDMSNAKVQLENVAKLPDLLSGLSSVSGGPAVGDALKASLSEEDEQRLTDICWELDDSGDEENEVLAKKLLGVLGTR